MHGQSAGAGVEGTVQKAGRRRHLRFGSQAFASQDLSGTQQQALADACQQQSADRVISVLVETASEQPSTSSSHSHNQSAPGQHSMQSSSEEGSTVSSSQQASCQSDDTENQIWIFAFEDTVHQRSAAALEDLRAGSWLGRGRKEKRLRVMMLTGDNEASAQRVAKQLRIDDVRAGLSPEQKLQVLITASA